MVGLLLKSPVFWAIVGTGAVLIGLWLYVVHYGDARYQEGVDHQRAEQAKSVAKQTDNLSAELVRTQADTLATLQAELATAKTNLVAASERATSLTNTIVELKNVKDTHCVSVDPKSLQLLNRAACAYNSQYGFSTGDTSGGGCPRPATPGASSSSVSSTTGGAIH